MTQKPPQEPRQGAGSSEEDKTNKDAAAPEFEAQPYPEPPPGISLELWHLLRGMADALDQCATGCWSAEQDTQIALDCFREWERKARARE